MNLQEPGLEAEVAARIEQVRERMRDSGLSALLVYGNNKVHGSLRYVSGYWPDRGGWLAAGPDRKDISIFDGATLVLPLHGEPVLVFDKGQLLDREAITALTTTSGLGGDLAHDPPIEQTIATILREHGAVDAVGIETWDKFPAPVFLALKDLLPADSLRPSTLIEELALVKSPWEIEIFREAGRIGDRGHEAFVEALIARPEATELELIRAAEHVMREANPLYEEASPISPSLISSGRIGRLNLLHVPQSKPVRRGDVVNWDLAMRYRGYPVDTSRTRVLGTATAPQRRAFEASQEMARAVKELVRPGTEVQDLVERADAVARAAGFELWDRFLGHGLGLDVHVRPDMGLERMRLAANMLITVEPRIAVDGEVLVGGEDMVLVTEDGCESLTHFPHGPLEINV